jgi:hypothetical protein
MGGGRKQVSYRLDEYHRDRMKEVVRRHLPDLHTESDIMQDAVWLWFYEFDKTEGNGNGTAEAGHRVHAASAQDLQQADGVAVGDVASAS